MEAQATFTLAPSFDEQLNAKVWDAITNAAERWAKRAEFPDYMDKKGACEYLGVSRGTLEMFITAGLPYTQIRQTVRLKKSDIDEFMKRNRF